MQFALLFQQGVHFIVAHGLGELVADGIELGNQVDDLAEAALDVAAHIQVFVQLGLLRQVADVDIGLGASLAVKFLVSASHDAQQRRLTRPIKSQHTDLCAGEETERDILENFPLGRNNLAHAMHGVNELRH